MRILLSNDDGYLSPGLRLLDEALSPLGRTDVVAPDRDRSGASHSLTLMKPLRAERHDNGYYAVDGTPTDCVHLALNGLLDEMPDMIVTGINLGANLGDDVHYSGTVAGAMEGRFLGYPAIAVSMVPHQPRHLETAARVARIMVDRLRRHPLDAGTILNINVPDLPLQDLSGWRVTRLGNRHKSEPIIPARDPRGQTCYWIGPAGAEQDAGPGTDFHAVAAGFVSVTPLLVDLTHHPQMQGLQAWLDPCSFD